jgi:hypothetical protein
VIYLAFAAVVLFLLPVAAQVGFIVGRRAAARCGEETRSHVVTWEGAVLGLAALLIGFTFAMAAGRYETRKQIVLTEANAIGTAYLRTQVLDEPRGEELRAMLRRYVDQRLELADAGADRQRISEAMRASGALERQIWSRVAGAARTDPHSVAIGLLVQATNEVIDNAEAYAFSLEHPVHPMVFLILVLVATIAMAAVGYSCGLERTRLAFGMLMMPVLLAAVIILVFDIAHPRIGIVGISNQSLIRLKQTF